MRDHMQIDLARETDATDLAAFLARLGFEPSRDGSALDLDGSQELVERAVASWLGESQAALVPAAATGGRLVLRPPAD
jgi:hypothetical protein